MRVTPDMSVLGSFEICNPAPESIIQSYADLAFNGENYVVVWSDEKYGEYYATAARVSPLGMVLDTGTCISTGTGGYEHQPKIARGASRCLAVWPKSSYAVQGRFVNNAGLPEDTVFNIAQNGSGPVIASDGTDYLVAWFTGAYPSLDIKARLVSASGSLIGPEVTITTDADCNRWPDVIFDGRQYIVVWTKGANSPLSQYVWAQAVSASGSLIDGNFPISANTAGQRWFPALAASDSNYLITWGQTGATLDIYGNVDHSLLMISEDVPSPCSHVPFARTFFRGSIKTLMDAGYIVYDVSGRKVLHDAARTGIYLIGRDDDDGEKIFRKIVVIR